MRIIIFLFMAGFFALFSAVGGADQGPIKAPAGGIVYGGDLAISVAPPAGWVFDSHSGISQGLHGVLYPEGSSWADSRQMIYVNISKLEPGESLGKFILADIENFAANSPGLRVEKMHPLTLQGGIRAEVWEFTGDQWGNCERSAYAQKGSSVAIFVLSSKSRAEYEKSLAAFAEMVTKSLVVEMTPEKGPVKQEAAPSSPKD